MAGPSLTEMMSPDFSFSGRDGRKSLPTMFMQCVYNVLLGLQCSNHVRMPGRSDWLSSEVGSVFSKGGVIFPGRATVVPTGVTSTGVKKRRMPERWREILEQLSGELERQSAKLQELEIENQQLRGEGLLIGSMFDLVYLQYI
jgi:hypothetical protein